MGTALPVLLARTLVIVCCLAASASAQAPRRVALIVANGDYVAAGRLDNPGNDARLIAGALRQAGFAVETRRDVGLRGFEQAMREFRSKADGAQVALVYFAGHGIESEGKNWLIPTDARLSDARDLPEEALDLDRALAAVSGAKLQIVVLDACRDNPFTRSWSRGTRSLSRGLSGLEIDGVLVIYAAAAGQTAADGDGDNSPFATSLAARLPQPGLAIQLLGNAVRADVVAATGRRQIPYVSESMGPDLFYLVPGAAPAPSPGPVTAEPAPPPRAERQRPNRGAVRVVDTGLSPGVRFRDCADAWCPDLALVAAGSFPTGPQPTGAASETRRPRRQVTIARPFALMTFEVTQAEWAGCVADGACAAAPGDGDGLEPVTGVSWLDAQGYAAWLSRKTGFAYRLPYEAEWERAARAGVDDAFGLGDGPLKVCDIANIAATDTSQIESAATMLGLPAAGLFVKAAICTAKHTALMPTGSMQANRFGFHDLIGNAAEWVADCWSDALLSPAAATQCPSTEERVIRGGSWQTTQADASLDKRTRALKGLGAPGAGFRLARSL